MMNHKCTPPGGNTTAGAELSAERRAYLRQVRRQKQEITLWRAGVLVGLLLLWEIAARLGWIDSFIMSSPSRILDTLFSLADNQILMHFSVTLYETLTGFVIGAFGGPLLFPCQSSRISAAVPPRPGADAHIHYSSCASIQPSLHGLP